MKLSPLLLLVGFAASPSSAYAKELWFHCVGTVRVVGYPQPDYNNFVDDLVIDMERKRVRFASNRHWQMFSATDEHLLFEDGATFNRYTLQYDKADASSIEWMQCKRIAQRQRQL